MTYDIPTHTSGDTFDGLEFNTALNSTPMNLTGVTIKLSISKGGAKPVSVFITGAGITITNAANGVWRWNSHVANLAPGEYDYDVQFTFPSGAVKTYISGKWKITKQISR